MHFLRPSIRKALLRRRSKFSNTRFSEENGKGSEINSSAATVTSSSNPDSFPTTTTITTEKEPPTEVSAHPIRPKLPKWVSSLLSVTHIIPRDHHREPEVVRECPSPHIQHYKSFVNCRPPFCDEHGYEEEEYREVEDIAGNKNKNGGVEIVRVVELTAPETPMKWPDMRTENPARFMVLFTPMRTWREEKAII